jgi:hypothetical protein
MNKKNETEYFNTYVLYAQSFIDFVKDVKVLSDPPLAQYSTQKITLKDRTTYSVNDAETGVTTPAPVAATPAPVAVVTSAPAAASMPSAGLPVSPGYPACDVCGAGNKVTKPDVEVVVPDRDPTTCAAFETGGQLGFIEPDHCNVGLLAVFLKDCGCAPTGGPVTPAPVAVVSPALPLPWLLLHQLLFFLPLRLP